MSKFNLKFCKEIWKIARGFWQSEEKWYARMLLVVIIGLQLLDVYILVRYNEWQNNFYNTIQNLDSGAFFSALAFWPVFTLLFLIIEINKLYLQQLLEVKWRCWLTNHYLEDWLQQRTYYLLQMFDNHTDNPDQRVSEDLRLFVSSVLSLSLGLLRAVVSLCSFTVVLWELSGVMVISLGQQQFGIQGYMVWVAILYAIAGSWLTAIIGKPLIELSYAQQRYEADFRFSLIRMREHSEGIAFYKGEQREHALLTKSFTRVLENFRGLMLSQKKLSWITLLHWRLSFLFPYLVAVPRIFSGQMQLGGLFQTATAFTQVELALSFFIRKYYSRTDASLAELQAVVSRLRSFSNSMEQIRNTAYNKSIKISYISGPTLVVKDLNVELPNGELLLKNLQLDIEAGERLLITGASGSGKSTLMKTLAGIWPLGQGTIHIPEDQNLLFLPQRPYIPMGTLREILAYPQEGERFIDQRLHEVMVMCRLGELIAHLEKEANWSHVLSLGEQQRIALARAILQRPQWLFLDEATSALDEATELALYRVLHEELKESAIISIGHRSTLDMYHKIKLCIGNLGAWRLAA